MTGRASRPRSGSRANSQSCLFGLRWEREQMPPPLAALANSNLPQAGKMPDPGNNWGPRVSLAIGDARGRWPVLRLGYGMYYGRVANATLETALTQTGSLNGDLNFFIRPTDGFTTVDGTSAAPPFPYVLTGPPASVVKPGAVEFAPNFRNPEVHQAVAAIEAASAGPRRADGQRHADARPPTARLHRHQSRSP